MNTIAASRSTCRTAGTGSGQRGADREWTTLLIAALVALTLFALVFTLGFTAFGDDHVEPIDRTWSIWRLIAAGALVVAHLSWMLAWARRRGPVVVRTLAALALTFGLIGSASIVQDEIGNLRTREFRPSADGIDGWLSLPGLGWTAAALAMTALAGVVIGRERRTRRGVALRAGLRHRD